MQLGCLVVYRICQHVLEVQHHIFFPNWHSFGKRGKNYLQTIRDLSVSKWNFQGVTLHEVMESEDIISECRAQNKNLIDLYKPPLL